MKLPRFSRNGPAKSLRWLAVRVGVRATVLVPTIMRMDGND